MKKTQGAIRGRPDFLLLILTLLLVGFGLVMVFSASSNIAVVSDRYNRDAFYFVKKQLLFAAVGSVVLFALMNIYYEKFKTWFIFYFIGVMFLLAIVPFVGKEINGAKSWLGFAGFGIQPTEFAKLAIILYLGRLISKKGEKFRDFKKGLLPVIVIVGFVSGLIMLQPDLGSCIILAICAGIMIVAGGSNLKHLFFTGVALSVLVALMVAISLAADPQLDKWGYRIARFTSFMNPLDDMLGTGYHLSHSLFALGHGGLVGAGFGHGVQKLHYLPYPYNDFIFAVIGEEFGFIGSVLFLACYVALIWRGLLVAIRCPDTYGTVVGAGIIGLISIQAFINIGGVSGLMPITGVTLPFISYGGSSLLITMASIGILLSISRESTS
ncbi:putative lipid II flippase FtsW [Paenibacillus sp. GCM10012307]|uniref:Probable peptidoglycan glycosyltransferase FtsW n=1 Tax=Paenibacillus roseus TaxID=2798579 RepID=A0A934J4S7_9BACL|nr:putative lipid II flippase FtsW [Paenibacillus roseus]MBJ6363284.1 putative lipid II flippase FtsW [Paenibacillus roseus]